MKKKILCFILSVLMLLGVLPISVFASEIARAVENSAVPNVVVSSLHSYSERDPKEFRALPDTDGVFHLDISLSKNPTDGSEIVVYYRTVDDSAVAKWGDYEGIGIEESVTLNKANGYKARVTVASTILSEGFYTSDEKGEPNKDKLITRRFIFELTRVTGNARLSADKSELYCYLRASFYQYQKKNAVIDSPTKGILDGVVEESLKDLETIYDKNHETYKLIKEILDAYYKDYESLIKYYSLYHSVTGASALNTPHIEVKGTHKDSINLSFNDEWKNYVQSGWCDLGISIYGTITREYWDSDGPATFNLYYYYQGEKKLALTLYLQGEFDDSTHFGWEHAFEYANEGLEGDNRDDHMDENFIGFTVYDNDGKEAYKVKINGRGEMDEVEVCGQLKKMLVDGNAVIQSYGPDDLQSMNSSAGDSILPYAYYLRLPSNFAMADSYFYEFDTESTRTDSKIEIRWLENVNLYFTLIGNGEPMIEKDGKGLQMVSTNLDTIKDGDPLRMSIRFDRPVHIADPNGKCYITTDIYNDKGACLVKGMKLTLKQLTGKTNGEDYHYAWDTLVFEGDLPDAVDGMKIATMRNIRIVDGSEDETEPTNGIRSFFSELSLLGTTIGTINVERDFRTPIATTGAVSTDNWTRSKSIDVYVNTESGARFNDYATVYYHWSNSTATPTSYSSKVVFHTSSDGEVMKTIIGTGNGEVYLHLKTVSAYGKESVSEPIGPFKFDNAPPTFYSDVTPVAGSMSNRVLSVPLPSDNGGSGLSTASLYYINKNGEGVLLKTFKAEEFNGENNTLTYTVPHTAVGACVDVDGNTVLKRETVEFYWVLTDKLGNTGGKTAEFSLVFDTNDYLDAEIEKIEPAPPAISEYVSVLDKYSFIYNIKTNGGAPFQINNQSFYYVFAFKIADGAFGDTDNGVYTAKVFCRGEPLTENTDFTVVKTSSYVSYGMVQFHTPLKVGRYDIQIVRTENESKRVSQTYSVYVTDGEEDDTPTKNKVESGTLLSNTVYQLSAEQPYFYYKDANGAVQKTYYNGTRQPASFSSLAKAREYVYYKELSDIYLTQLSAATASALISGTAGYQIAKGETVTPQEGQYWIRYKSDAWTPTSGDSAWVYYYYGMSEVLSENALPSNLQSALSAVANRIAGYGRTVVLTDSSLFLGSSMGDRLLDKYGMPYLAPEQIHSEDELSNETVCGIAWSSSVGFAADKNIYKSKVIVGVEETEYPIVGNFAISEDLLFMYVPFNRYSGGNTVWQPLDIKKDEAFVDYFTTSGIYYIREISKDGISVFAIYVDKEAPRASFFNTDEKGDFREIPIDGVEILDVRTKDLYIGSIAQSEYDRLSYVAVYKVSNLSLVGVYNADELSAAPIRLEDGNYYIVVADRSGNCYTVNAKVSSTELECNIKESTDRFIRLTCNRKADQIQRYEVYLNGVLVTSTYTEEATFEKAGIYTVYVQDIYGNVFSREYTFTRNYPTVTWKYYGTDGKYHTYDPNADSTNGFILTWVSDNQYKISTAVRTRFSFSGSYAYEFVGAIPEYSESLGTETTVTIEAGQSFTLKVYYKNHKECYSIYSGTVDVTPPSVSVFADVDVLENGEYRLFEEWAKKGNVGDVITMKDLYYVLSEIAPQNVANGASVSSDIIKINASDASELSLIEIYLDGTLLRKQDTESGFSQVVVNKWGKYRIIAKDRLGNVSEFNFTNGMPDYFDYFVDGVKKEQELHGYLNFETVGGRHVYTKADYGKTDFRLNVKQNADVFISVGLYGEAAEIYGFRISDGLIYPLVYKIALDKNGKKTVEIDIGEAIIDTSAKDFKLGQEYLISKAGAYAVYASLGTAKTVNFKVYAPKDSSKVVSVGARVELVGSHTAFVSAELSKKSSDISFKGSGAQTNDTIYINGGFIIDESTFDSERISSVSLYYSKVNDLDVSKLEGKTNVYITDREYDSEGFYLLIVRNRYGNERVYKIAFSRSFGITSSVTFGDGYKIFYSSDYSGTLYSNGEITLDIIDAGVTVEVTLNGTAYTRFAQKKEDSITYLIFSEAGEYEVKLTDSYGNVITRRLEINKSAFSVSDELLTGYNEKALKRDDGYTNQKLSIDTTVYGSAGIYYLAVQHGETVKVLFDSFSETPVSVDMQSLVNVVGSQGDGIYKVICRNRYGAVVTKDIHYRETPTLKLTRTTRSKSESEVYDLDYAVSHGFWSNNTLSFSTEAKIYVFTVNGSVTECPRTLVFENAGDFGSFEYVITYIDEYGFEYSFKAYLVRKNVAVDISPSVGGTEIDGVLNTKKDIVITFGENVYATYTRNNGQEKLYRSGDVLKKDGTYRFTVIDYAGNTTLMTVKKDTAVEFSFVDSVSGNTVQNGGIVNNAKVSFNVLNKDSAYIETVVRNGAVQTDFEGSKFSEDGKWELIICDKLGNRAYFCFYIITRSQNGFVYTTPYEYRITEMWYDSGDGVKVSYMAFVNRSEYTSSFDVKENGKYTVVMSSDVTGLTSTFEFTVNTNAPEVSLVGCNNGETTINDVTLTGHKVGDRIRIYRASKTGEELVEEIEITSLATKIPTITEGGKYRIVVESEAGVQTELSLVRKHVMNTAGSVFIMVVIGLSVIGLFTGLVYRNKSKTDD